MLKRRIEKEAGREKAFLNSAQFRPAADQSCEATVLQGTESQAVENMV